MLTLKNIPASVYLRAIELEGVTDADLESAREIYNQLQSVSGGLERAIFEHLTSGEGFEIETN